MSKKASFAITHVDLYDPYTQASGIHHLVIEEGVIKTLTKKRSDIDGFEGKIIDGKGLLVSPGFCDPHVHFRDPGFLEKETIESGAKAALAGGFTDVACMANTDPVNDNPTTLGYIKYKAQQTLIGIHPICAVTKNLEGKSLVAFEHLLREGAIAFSDDGSIIGNEKILLQALKRLGELGALFIGHCETKSLSDGTRVNLGATSFELGIDGNPDYSEGLSVFTHLYLAQIANTRIHIAHVSTRRALEWIKFFKDRSVNLSCEVTPHHLLLTDACLMKGEGEYIVSPPLRSSEDKHALQLSLKEGLIDCIATDHAPHTQAEKARGLEGAPPGMIGLETALPVLWHLVKEKILTREQLITRMSRASREILRLSANSIEEGKVADLVFYEETKPYAFEQTDFYSKSSNSPFLHTEGLIKIRAVIAKGILAHAHGKHFQ